MKTVAAQDWPNFRHYLMPNAYPPNPIRFGNHAKARNAMLDGIGDWGYILWVDVDIVELPADLITRLMAHMTAKRGINIIAPVVRIQHVEGVWSGYNGWFYDINGWVDKDGAHPGPQFHPMGTELIPMQSVGCVYLVKSRLHAHARYKPAGNEVEHISYCREVGGVYVDPTLVVKHANLPAYGLSWHTL